MRPAAPAIAIPGIAFISRLLQFPAFGVTAGFRSDRALLPDRPGDSNVAAMARNAHTSGYGRSQRQLRVGELIRRALSDILNRGEIHDPDLDRMSITVGEVRASPDLRVATAYVLPLGGGKREEALDALRRNQSKLRRAVDRNLTLKFSPELRFVLDETYDQMEDTRRLLAQDAVRRDLGGNPPNGRN